MSLAKALLGVVLAALTVLLLFTANLLQALSLPLRFFSPRLFRRINRQIANIWWGICVLLGKLVLGYKVVITGDEVPMRENAIVIANHQEMPDIFVVMVFAFSKGRLGDLKFFVKEALKYVPGVGWGMWMLDCVFLRRTWADDESRIRQTFRNFTRHRIPFWLTLYPEGTRARPEKLERSRSYARERNLPVLEFVLNPRTKGFTAAMTGLRPLADAVYDLTIAYEGRVPTLWDLVLGRAKIAHLHVKRFPVAGLPMSEPELSAWLIGRFTEKDALLRAYKSSGRFAP